MNVLKFEEFEKVINRIKHLYEQEILISEIMESNCEYTTFGAFTALYPEIIMVLKTMFNDDELIEKYMWECNFGESTFEKTYESVTIEISDIESLYNCLKMGNM